MAKTKPTFETEENLIRQGYNKIVGVDEAGRGCLAGPVVAAAVWLDPNNIIDGLNDSKKLTPARREVLFDDLHKYALGIGIGIVDNDTIDVINILSATLLAMENAVGYLCYNGKVFDLELLPDFLLIDGDKQINIAKPQQAIVDGDAKCLSIAAASIVAKVTRDRLMEDYDRMYPGYGFGKHKAYGTKQHRDAIAELGVCPIHRKTFKGVKEYVRWE